MHRIVLVVAMVMLLTQVMAQEPAQSLPVMECSAEQYQQLQDQIAGILSGLDNPDQPAVISLTLARAALDTWQMHCTGGEFNAASHASGIVTLLFGTGVYQLTLISPEGPGTVDWTKLGGDCGVITFFGSTESAGGEENIIVEMANCVAVFDIDAPGLAWEFFVQRLS